MTLSVKNPILPIDIADIQVYKNGKILVLTGHEGERIVLKTELGTSVGEVKNARAVMKAVDSSLKTKIVTLDEIGYLLEWVDMSLEIEVAYANLPSDDKSKKGAGSSNMRKESLTALRRAITDWREAMTAEEDINNARNPLLKLNYIEVTDIKAEVEKRLKEEDKDKTGVRAFVRALNGTGGFETLGKVVAADLVNDNNDRFAVDGGGSLLVGNRTFEFKALVNAGNVFLNIAQGGANTLSGLDFIAPTGKRVNKDINAALTAEHPIHHLASRDLRSRLAADIVADLELMLNPKKKRYTFAKLDSNASKRLVAGMIEGAKLIAAELDRKYRKDNRWTDGVSQRFDVLKTVR